MVGNDWWLATICNIDYYYHLKQIHLKYFQKEKIKQFFFSTIDKCLSLQPIFKILGYPQKIEILKTTFFWITVLLFDQIEGRTWFFM